MEMGSTRKGRLGPTEEIDGFISSIVPLLPGTAIETGL